MCLLSFSPTILFTLYIPIVHIIHSTSVCLVVVKWEKRDITYYYHYFFFSFSKTTSFTQYYILHREQTLTCLHSLCAYVICAFVRKNIKGYKLYTINLFSFFFFLSFPLKISNGCRHSHNLPVLFPFKKREKKPNNNIISTCYIHTYLYIFTSFYLMKLQYRHSYQFTTKSLHIRFSPMFYTYQFICTLVLFLMFTRKQGK